MYVKNVTIINRRGLHARPGSDFVNAAGQFKSKITIRRTDENGDPVNAKSIVFVLSLGVGRGVEIELAANGEDEQEAVDFLTNIITGGFGDL
ncbi:MAG: HPr family phosphocarrier protein [Treponema sp.]|nr:HPr family phosphocarrier protein [Treponema sp.]